MGGMGGVWRGENGDNLNSNKKEQKFVVTEIT